MEFMVDYLNTIIENLSDEPSVNVVATTTTTTTNNNNSSSTTVKTEPFLLHKQQTLITANNNRPSTTIKNEPSIFNEEQTLITANNNTDRHYCLIIFNNPHWSQRLRKRHASQVEQEQMSHEPNGAENIIVKSEPEDVPSLDDRFITQLQQLINDYMLHTKRPFPIKYFLDFTTN